MGFFSFFGKKKPPVKEEMVKPQKEEITDVEVSDISEWFSITFGNELKSAQTHSINLCEKIMGDFLNMKKSLDVLQDAVFEGDDKLYTSAGMVKDTYVKKLSSSIQTIQVPSKNEYHLLKEFYLSSIKILNDMKSLSPKQKYLLSMFFKAPTADVINDISEIESRLKTFDDFMKSNGKIIKLSEDFSKQSGEYTFLVNNMKSISNRGNEVSKSLDQSTKKYEEIELKIREISEGADFKKMNYILGEINNHNEKIQEIEKQINTDISSIKRPLKKLEHHTNESFSWLSNPFRDIVLENRENVMKKAAENVLKLANDGKIILKPSEREKINSLLSKESDINKLKSEYKEFMQKIKEKKKFIGDNCYEIVKEKEDFEASLEKENVNKERLNAQKKAISEEKIKLKTEIDNHRNALEKLVLEKSGKAIHINYNV